MEQKVQKNTQIYIWVFGVIILIIAMFLMFLPKTASKTNDTANNSIDNFASCIAESGAKMYGAFWCSHCETQKEDFENSKNLPYVECSTKDGKSQTAICASEGIKSYPTWKFGNGSEASGALSFAAIAKATGCEAPL